MSRFARIVRAARWVAFAVSCLAFAAAATPNAVELAFTVDVPPGRASLAEITSTLVGISTARTWTLMEKSDGKVVVHLVHRKIDATVTYVFTELKIQAYCESYQVDSSGKRGKPEQPTRWLKYLQDDIRRLLGGPVGTTATTGPVAAATPSAATPTLPTTPTPPPTVASPASAPPATLPGFATNMPSAPSSAPAPTSATVPPAVFPPATLPPAAPATAILPASPAPAPQKIEGVQLVQFPTEAISPVSYYSRVYVVRPKPSATGDAGLVRLLDESPGAQAGPGRAMELGTLETERVFSWNRPAGIMSLRGDPGVPATPRLALELAAGKEYFVVVEGSGAATTFRLLPETEGKALVAAAKPATVSAEARDSLDAYLVAAASDGRADTVNKFLNADRGRSYSSALTAAIDQAQPLVTNMLLKAGATVPTDNTPDGRFRMGAVLKALADMKSEEGKPAEAKKYYEQAMALFNAVKPELMAAAEAKFQKAREKAAGDSVWSKLADFGGKALTAAAAAQGGGGNVGAGANQGVMAQLMALKNSGSFDQFFSKVKTSGNTPPTAPTTTASKEIPPEVMALLDLAINKAGLEKSMSDRCDLLVSEIQKKLVAQN